MLPWGAFRHHVKPDVGFAHIPLSPFAGFWAQLGLKALDRHFHIFRDRWQEASFVARDGVSGHTEFGCQLALSETEEEPSFPKVPSGQA